MNRVPKLLSAFALTLVCATATTFGQITNGNYDLYTFDKLGNGYFQVAGTGPIPLFIESLPGTIAQDPFSGLFTLRYNVPATMAPGDLIIDEHGPQNLFSDLIRFDGQGHLFYFTLHQPGAPPTMADVPVFPALLAQFPIEALEASPFPFPFAGDGVIYTPITASQQPGSDIFADQFRIITSAPEPATTFLLLLGASLFLLRRRRLCLRPV